MFISIITVVIRGCLAAAVLFLWQSLSTYPFQFHSRVEATDLLILFHQRQLGSSHVAQRMVRISPAVTYEISASERRVAEDVAHAGAFCLANRLRTQRYIFTD